MRPRLLKVKSFTSFRDEQEIDFADLDLFAIVGPTGSGKSSLLDAMTYALFGYADRVGRQIGQLVSQGQPRAAVTLEFDVGAERFRVTRRTPASKGQTQVQLERWRDGGWAQAGEGSDRVREVNATIEKAIGLDYDAFTRAVLLPQGTFAAFLNGDAKDRRSILTELLGLELFERLAKRAGELRRTAEQEAKSRTHLLETEYAGVTPQAVRDSERAASEAADRERAFAVAGTRVREISDRAQRAEAQITALLESASEADSLADVAAKVADELGDLADREKAARESLRQAIALEDAAAAAATDATSARERAEVEGGTEAALAEARARVEALVTGREDLAEREGRLADAEGGIASLREKVARAERSVASEADACAAAAENLAEARAAAERARHANLVAAVRADVHVGEDCPVCGATISELSDIPGADDLDAADERVEAAERDLADRDAAVRRAEKARDGAAAKADHAATDAERLASELQTAREQLAAGEEQLAGVLGEGPDPIAALDERLAALRQLLERERTCAADTERARRERVEAERSLDKLLGRVGQQRTALAARDAHAMIRRAINAAGDELEIPSIPGGADLPNEAPALAAAADGIAGVARGVARKLQDMASARAERTTELLAEAGAALAEVARPEEIPGTLEATIEFVEDAARRSAGEAATATQRAQMLAERLERSRELAKTVRQLRARAERFAALTAELRADRIMEFLQHEALQVLAAAGSERLATLSEGRYRLAYVGDEFFVVDTWNGEEQRSARTLSGGESFLASLALALALSEQVRSLAVTEKAPLESLFLDEGFGTLDPETLEVVVAAIEQLGGDGRMVGVITHVQELAIRLPTRIEIQKSPRGSSITVAS